VKRAFFARERRFAPQLKKTDDSFLIVVNPSARTIPLLATPAWAPWLKAWAIHTIICARLN
jgi:hypothetical protein